MPSLTQFLDAYAFSRAVLLLLDSFNHLQDEKEINSPGEKDDSRDSTVPVKSSESSNFYILLVI